MKVIASFVLLIFMWMLGKGQTQKDISDLEIRYNFHFMVDTLNRSSSIVEPMILITNSKTSKFYSEYYINSIDLVNQQLREGSTSIIDLSSIPQAKVKHIVYKNNSDIFISNILGETNYTFNNNNEFSWKIHSNDHKEILSYKCTKATMKLGKRNFTAWFAYDIPISNGPYKFGGLPGLILEFKEDNEYFSYQAISIKEKKVPIEFVKDIMITREQYLKKKKEYISDPSQGKNNSPEYRKIIEGNIKKYNNSLEE